jgi:hypothetical protein
MRYLFFVSIYLLLFLPVQVYGENNVPSFEEVIAGVNMGKLNAFLAEAFALRERAEQRKTNPSLGNPCANALKYEESECLVKPDGEVVIAKLQVLVFYEHGHRKLVVTITGRIRVLPGGIFYFDPREIPYQDGWSHFGEKGGVALKR